MRTNNRELLIEKYTPPTEFLERGARVWRNKYGELHSFNRQPAFIYYYYNPFDYSAIECKKWFKNGKCLSRQDRIFRNN